MNPFTVEVIRNAFDSIASQMNNNLARSAYTPTIYEMKDCSTGVFDADVNLLGESAGLPIFLGNLQAVILATTEHFGGPEIYQPGDVYMVNDPYITGSHLNDVTVFSPIFYSGDLVGFGATKAHWMDIGAKEPGETVDSTEIYQEGYRLGPTHLYRAGQPERPVLDFLTRNSRLPQAILGDMAAQIAACRTGELRLQALYERFGAAAIAEASQEIFAQCERLDQEAVLAIPDGVYRTYGELDSWGPGGDPVPVAVAVIVEGDQLTIDLTGSSPMTPGAVNCGFAQTVSGARLAYRFLVNPDAPVTAGTFRNLHVIAAPGLAFHAQEPAACQFYYAHIGLMIDLIIKALSAALPDRVVAGQTASAENVIFSGKRPDGSTWVVAESTAIGWGAHAAGDGASALVNYGAGDLKNFPIEVMEARFPLRLRRYGYRRGSGGTGRHRGGDGIVREYETLDDSAHVTLWFERTRTKAWGLFGGHDGTPTQVHVTAGDGEPRYINKAARLPLPRGSLVLVETGGGGGYGSPDEAADATSAVGAGEG